MQATNRRSTSDELRISVITYLESESSPAKISQHLPLLRPAVRMLISSASSRASISSDGGALRGGDGGGLRSGSVCVVGQAVRGLLSRDRSPDARGLPLGPIPLEAGTEPPFLEEFMMLASDPTLGVQKASRT